MTNVNIFVLFFPTGVRVNRIVVKTDIQVTSLRTS